MKQKVNEQCTEPVGQKSFSLKTKPRLTDLYPTNRRKRRPRLIKLRMKRLITESNKIQSILGKYLENIIFRLENEDMNKF